MMRDQFKRIDAERRRLQAEDRRARRIGPFAIGRGKPYLAVRPFKAAAEDAVVRAIAKLEDLKKLVHALGDPMAPGAADDIAATARRCFIGGIETGDGKKVLAEDELAWELEAFARAIRSATAV